MALPKGVDRREQRVKFETGFKQQVVGEVKSGLLSAAPLARNYQISSRVIDRWWHQPPKAYKRKLSRFERKL
jgi:hypothetical protein